MADDQHPKRYEETTHSVEQLAEHANEHGSPENDGPHWIRNEWLAAGASFVLLMVGISLDQVFKPEWFSGFVRLLTYLFAYTPVSYPVIIRAAKLAAKGEIFTEFFLMGLATIGAFYIGEYPEGVTVMLFYTVGELIQGVAVNRAKGSIKALMDIRPESATVFRNNNFSQVVPTQVVVGEKILVKAGERVPLDGKLHNSGTFNAAALTGESAPVDIAAGDDVLAGMINEGGAVEIQVTRLFGESSLSRILTLVQNAQGRKARTELLIRKFAKVYTPIVVFLSVMVVVLPVLFVKPYSFDLWLYRALIFLVISCPCALVVAIPLGYFGGIGAASRNGILFKGSTYLDRMTRVGTVVFDKTGTLTQGVFIVKNVVNATKDNEWVFLAAALESKSTHPVARAVLEHAGIKSSNITVDNVEEIKGSGLKGNVAGKEVLVGNARLMMEFGVAVSIPPAGSGTIVMVAVDRIYSGYLTIADEIRSDARAAIARLHARGIRTVMLSGDRQDVVSAVATTLGIETAFGDLLPEDKVRKLEDIKKENDRAVAFVGDGINDAPVLALSDVGIAMGALGSDAAIETADVVIQNDQPSRVVTAMDIGHATNRIVWQNITLAFGVKILVMVLGTLGIASMWGAVFADVGVALLAILNAIRIQRMKF
jgi:Zn2+/Cd2+-exporting ATPase